MDNLSIESLIKIFDEHDKKALVQLQKDIEQFRESYPNDPQPEWFNSDFRITAALKLICEEIKKLQTWKQKSNG